MTTEQHPDFALRFERRPGYLYAFASGPRDSLEVSTRVWREIRAKATELDCNRVLVEENFPNQLSTVDMFQIAELVAELFRGDAKVAHVDQQLSDMALNRFGETVAVNRGLTGRVFNRVEDAERWLAE